MLTTKILLPFLLAIAWLARTCRCHSVICATQCACLPAPVDVHASICVQAARHSSDLATGLENRARRVENARHLDWHAGNGAEVVHAVVDAPVSMPEIVHHTAACPHNAVIALLNSLPVWCRAHRFPLPVATHVRDARSYRVRAIRKNRCRHSRISAS